MKTIQRSKSQIFEEKPKEVEKRTQVSSVVSIGGGYFLADLSTIASVQKCAFRIPASVKRRSELNDKALLQEVGKEPIKMEKKEDSMSFFERIFGDCCSSYK